MGIVEQLFNVFAPHDCLACKTEGGLLCQRCWEGLEKVPERCYGCGRRSDGGRTCVACRKRSPLYSVYAAVKYEGAAKDLIHALKFARAKAGAVIIAKVLAGACTEAEDVLITYAPTAHRRVRERGYDQSALIAKELAVRLDRPCLPLLARMGGQRQLGQSREERKKQMREVFRPLGTIDLRQRHVLLVDDVLTTGATCESAARALRQAGAKRVSAVVFAVA